jgi:Cu2+-exporting ATPase
VVEAADKGLVGATPRDFKAIPGKGAEAVVEGRQVKVVSPGYVRTLKVAVDDARVGELGAQGKTVVFVLVDDRPIGAIALADLVREESRDALSRLKQLYPGR